MVEVRTSAEFDYENQKIHVTVQQGAATDFNYQVAVMSPRGYMVGRADVVSTSQIYNLRHGSAEISMISTNVSRGCKNIPASNQFYFGEPYTEWGFADELGNPALSAIAASLASGFQEQINLSQTDDCYTGVPFILTRGPNTAHVKIDSVSGKQYISFSNSNVDSALFVTARASELFTNCMGLVISGVGSGTRFFVTDTTITSNQIAIDRDATSWSGSIIKLCPYGIISDYSGWNQFTPGTQFDGAKALFTSSTQLPQNVGNLYGATYNYSADVSYDVGTLYGTSPVGLSIFTSRLDVTYPQTYLETIEVGDIAVYEINSASSINTGTIVNVTKAGSVFTIDIYPASPVPIIDSVGEVDILKNNTIELHLHPKFNTDHMIHVYDTAGTFYNTNTVRAPSAQLEYAANDFDSTYATVGERSHFHIGPIHLSNGQRIDNYCLSIAADLYQGDVTTTTPISSWLTHGTRSTDLGSVLDGMHYRQGIFTTTYNQAFNGSETLLLNITARLGPSVISRVLTIPVQPSI